MTTPSPKPEPSSVSRGSFTRTERFAILINVVLICVLGAAVAAGFVTLVADLSYRIPLRKDITSGGRFSLDPAAANVVDSIKEPVRVTLVVGIDQDRKSRVQDLSGTPRMDVYDRHYRPILLEFMVRAGTVLEEWSRRNANIRIDVIEKDADLARLKIAADFHGKPADEMVNKVIFRCGSRERVVPIDWLARTEWGFFPPDPRRPAVFPEILGPWQIQAVLTSSLKSVSSGESTSVAVPRGAKSALEPESTAFLPILKFLKGFGYEVVSFRLRDGVPDECPLLILPALGGKLDPSEAEKLREFDAAGGRTLLLGDWSRAEDYVALLEPYGVKLPPLVVEDPPNKRAGQPDTFLIESSRLAVGLHPIDIGIKDRSTLFLGTVRPISVDDKVRGQGVSRIPLLRGSADSKVAPVDFNLSDDKATPDLGKRVTSASPMLASALTRPGSSGRESRVVVVGTPEILQPDLLTIGGNYGNRDFVLNALNWLSERTAVIGGIADRDLLGSRIELTDGLISGFRWIFVVVIPVLLALIGFVIHLRRRR